MNKHDNKAKKILFGTFWKNGWIDSADRSVSTVDFEYAKAKELMFDPLTIAHDDLISRIVNLYERIPRDKVAKAFLSSLSARRLDWRSSLASWSKAEDLTCHPYQEQVYISGYSYDTGVEKAHVTRNCAICGGDEHYTEEDLNILNFERIRWGGVRHGNLIYALLDLEQLNKSCIPEPTEQDIFIFLSILKTVEASQPKDTPGKLRNRLKNCLPSNQPEIEVLIEILAFCGILEAKEENRPGLPGRHDWNHAADWRGEDGYDVNLVHEIFGTFL